MRPTQVDRGETGLAYCVPFVIKRALRAMRAPQTWRIYRFRTFFSINAISGKRFVVKLRDKHQFAGKCTDFNGTPSVKTPDDRVV